MPQAHTDASKRTARTRGYPKGRARRRQILEAAYDLYVSNSERPTLRQIAERVGLTEAGVLHHFDSMDELFVAILEERDEQAAQLSMDEPEDIWEYLRWTTRTPGLTRLFVDMSVAGIDPQHPAHGFLQRHHERVAELLGEAFGVSDPVQVRMVTAAAEGLQLRWLHDPSLPLAEDLRTLMGFLSQGDKAGENKKTK